MQSRVSMFSLGENFVFLLLFRYPRKSLVRQKKVPPYSQLDNLQFDAKNVAYKKAVYHAIKWVRENKVFYFFPTAS